jgi:hypothetical protein
LGAALEGVGNRTTPSRALEPGIESHPLRFFLIGNNIKNHENALSVEDSVLSVGVAFNIFTNNGVANKID